LSYRILNNPSILFSCDESEYQVIAHIHVAIPLYQKKQAKEYRFGLSEATDRRQSPSFAFFI